jgi:hypothetical protein
MLENAGVVENVAADIIGHDKPTMTYGLYSGGNSFKQAAMAHFMPGTLQRLPRLPSDTLVRDLRYRLRCAKCNSRDRFTVAVESTKWPPDQTLGALRGHSRSESPSLEPGTPLRWLPC